MQAEIEIAGHDLIVEYEIKITSHSYPATGPSYSSGGEPGGPAEFEIVVHGLRIDDGTPELEMPVWLCALIAARLAERDDINEIAQQMDCESGEQDPDDARDEMLDRDADQ